MAIETRRDVSGGEPVEPVPVRVHPTAPASFGLLLLRIPLGVYFILAGVGHIRGGIGHFIGENIAAAMGYMPENVARGFLTALPYAEITLGVMLILGLLGRFAGLVCSLLLISFTVAATGVRQPGLPFHPNLLMLGMGLAVLFCGPGRFSVDGLLFRPRRKVVVTKEYTEPV
jgi:uncharacterized membrane protein YphA (DoxX/SURF4 family)